MRLTMPSRSTFVAGPASFLASSFLASSGLACAAGLAPAAWSAFASAGIGGFGSSLIFTSSLRGASGLLVSFASVTK